MRRDQFTSRGASSNLADGMGHRCGRHGLHPLKGHPLRGLLTHAALERETCSTTAGVVKSHTTCRSTFTLQRCRHTNTHGVTNKMYARNERREGCSEV